MNISFIIPAYNEEKNIINCIESIERSCYQYMVVNDNYNLNYEIVVVDNNSIDETYNKVIRYIKDSIIINEDGSIRLPNVKIVKEFKKGVTRARQKGYLEAKYDIQAYIDADNRITYDWLDYIKYIEDYKVVGLTGYLVYPDNSKFAKISYNFFFFMQTIFHQIFPSIQGGNFVLKKSALDKIGGHSTNYEFYGEDTDLAKRISKHGKIKIFWNMKVISSNRRFKNEGIFKTTFKYAMNYFSVYLLNKPLNKNYKDYR